MVRETSYLDQNRYMGWNHLYLDSYCILDPQSKVVLFYSNDKNNSR